MASVERREGKKGTSYRITVSCGMDSGGRQIKRTKTWKPEPGMTARQVEKALNREVVEFEREVEIGYHLDDRQTFQEYSRYFLAYKKQIGLKHATLANYEYMLGRINKAIGHIKLSDIRPQHLNLFLQNLQEDGIKRRIDYGVLRVDLRAWLRDHNLSVREFAERTGYSKYTIQRAINKEKLLLGTANAIAAAMGMKPEECFDIQLGKGHLANRTVQSYHRVISAVLGQAEKEMLVPYNSASKTTVAKEKTNPNYFQPDDVRAILEALESESLKWRTMVHLFIVTGCRRGELVGLKWDKIDFERHQILVENTLLVDQGGGKAYASTTKSGKSRRIVIPKESVSLLKQYREEQERIRQAMGEAWQDTGYVFTNEFGQPMHPHSVNLWMKKFAKRHGFKKINPHAFRHTAASILISEGTDIVTVSQHLGHADVTTTEKTYAHIIEEKRNQAAECIADVLLRKKGEEAG